MNETESPYNTRKTPSKSKGRVRRSIARHMRRNLITGSLMLVPVALTYLVLRFIFDLTDGVLQPTVQWAFQRFGLDWTVPGVGLLVAVILVYFTGFFLANAVGRRMARWAQGAVMHLPLIGTVYSASRKLVESFSGTGETGFKRVVMLEYPRQNAWTIGFLTAITTALDGKRMAVVYIPTAPTPTSGWVAMVPIEDVWDTDLTVQTAMQAVFSGGIVTPAVIKTRKLELTGILDSILPETTEKGPS
ncbi:MAG: DUF502 domain-containing protein [Dehalococcoidia bacterium]|nr:DUF502 domain-containing protein [Dehalococcoidia bacterium]